MFIGCVCFLALVWQAASEPAVAIVESVTGGKVLLREQGKKWRAPGRYEWIRDGSEMTVGKDSKLVLLFSSGKRWQFEQNSAARLTAEGPANSRGTIRSLESLLPLPQVSPVVGPPPLRASAVRIRGTRIRGLYPSSPAAAISSSTVLRFSPVAGISLYRVEIYDDAGKPVFATQTSGPQVPVPSGYLFPGRYYDWLVRGSTADGALTQEAVGEASFATLSADAVAKRAALGRALRDVQNADTLGLVAEIDLALGLFDEAATTLRQAVALRPADRDLQHQSRRVQQMLIAR